MTHMYTTSHSRFPFLSLSRLDIRVAWRSGKRSESTKREGERGKKENKKKAGRWDRKKRGQSLDFSGFRWSSPKDAWR